jgi:hypothetical protein
LPMSTGLNSADASLDSRKPAFAEAAERLPTEGENEYASRVIAQATRQIVSAIGPIPRGPTTVDE